MTTVYRFINTKICNFQLYVAFFEICSCLCIFQISMEVILYKPRLRYNTSILTWTGPVMQLSHLSRFDHDWYRGLHRGPIGTIVSNLIRSHHILIQIVIIGLIVGKFLAAKNFATITTICGTIVTIASDRMTS